MLDFHQEILVNHMTSPERRSWRPFPEFPETYLGDETCSRNVSQRRFPDVSRRRRLWRRLRDSGDVSRHVSRTRILETSAAEVSWRRLPETDTVNEKCRGYVEATR